MNAFATKKTETQHVGKRVEVLRYGQKVTGTVVGETLFPWCPGANTILVLLDDAACTLARMSAIGNQRELKGERGDVEACRVRMQAHLSQYAVWAARFEAGLRYEF